MPFVWTQNIAVDALIDAADINEVKTNLDTIYAALAITRGGCGAGGGWVELPVGVGDLIKSVDFQEMRAVADFANDNRCPSFDVADFGSDEAVHDAGVNNLEDSGYHSNNEDNYENNDHGTYQSGDDEGYNATNENSFKGFNDVTV